VELYLGIMVSCSLGLLVYIVIVVTLNYTGKAKDKEAKSSVGENEETT